MDATMMDEQNQPPPQPIPEEPDEYQDQIKATINSISPQDEDLEFYERGLISFAESLTFHDIRKSFKKNNGFSVLIRNEKIRDVMAKVVDEMHLGEMKVLKAAYILSKAAAEDFRDNAVRSLQVRGILDNVYEMIATKKRVPEDVALEGIQYAIKVLEDPSVCKLMCNKYDLSDPELFNSNYGDFGQNYIHANFVSMLRTGGNPNIQREGYKLVETIAQCPRFYVRVLDQKAEKLDKLAVAVRDGMQNGSQEPVSFGAFCRAVIRLCQHGRIREALFRVPDLIDACRTALETLMDEVSPEGSQSLGHMFGCLSVLLVDMNPTPHFLEQCQVMEEMANQVLQSGRAAMTRRWARAGLTALKMSRLHDDPTQVFELTLQLFNEHCDGIFNDTDEFQPTPEVVKDPQRIVNMLNDSYWFDAPHKFYCGIFRGLGRSVADSKDTEFFENYKENGGFNMFVRHRSLTPMLRKELKDMTSSETWVLMGIWDMALGVMPGNSESEVRYLQIPNIVDNAAAMMRRPNDFPAIAHITYLKMLCYTCEKQHICRMVCNRVDFPEFMIKLFSIPLTMKEADKVEELNYKFFRLLTQCQKLAQRLKEENHFEDLISGIEVLICEGWSRPLMFRRLLDCVVLLVSQLRKLKWDRPTMMEAMNTAVSMLATMEEVPDHEAAMHLVRLTDLLLKRGCNEELLGALKILVAAEQLPEECRSKAKETIADIESSEQSD